MVDAIIVGQGIAGSFLAYEFIKNHKEILVFDECLSHTSSRIAGAVLHPLNTRTGKINFKKEEEIGHALKAYREFEAFLSNRFVYTRKLLSVQNQFEVGDNGYITTPDSECQSALNVLEGKDETVCVEPVYQINGEHLLNELRNYLTENNSFFAGKLDSHHLKVYKDHVAYCDFKAKSVIFCNGTTPVENFVIPEEIIRNMGNVLYLNIPELDNRYIYQKNNVRLSPLSSGLFWCGTNHDWNYTTPKPDLTWKNETILFLRQWLKTAFEVVDHKVAERPTTAGQLTICSKLSPHLKTFMINGLGTRGYTLAPILAKKLFKEYFQ